MKKVALAKGLAEKTSAQCSQCFQLNNQAKSHEHSIMKMGNVEWRQ